MHMMQQGAGAAAFQQWASQQQQQRGGGMAFGIPGGGNRGTGPNNLAFAMNPVNSQQVADRNHVS